MSEKRHLFTSESVTEGHPDKVCDRISDAILDELLSQDPRSRVACEVLVKDNTVVLAGEITTTAAVDYAAVAREAINEIGYTEDCGFCGDSCEVKVMLREQSPDIAMGVNEKEDGLGAGDQGMMFGYACDETEELMPWPIMLAHNLTKALTEARKSGDIDYLRPDGKSQVTVEYENGEPLRIDTVVISTQHAADVDMETLRRDIKDKVILPSLPKKLIDADTKYFINPTGRFVIGGPVGDCGLTGRKIIVDTYGGYSRHGGGAFSGKDPSKVDRSAAYMARYIAKNIVAAGLAKRCEVQLAYAIGVAKPVSVLVETFDTETVPCAAIEAAVKQTFDMRPSAIIKILRLNHPQFSKLAAYGHMGRNDLDVEWERTNKADELKAAVKLALK
ncbi:MAG: methionine adenosyltransferase [Oscillospiraceae bacterium]